MHAHVAIVIALLGATTIVLGGLCCAWWIATKKFFARLHAAHGRGAADELCVTVELVTKKLARDEPEIAGHFVGVVFEVLRDGSVRSARRLDAETAVAAKTWLAARRGYQRAFDQAADDLEPVAIIALTRPAAPPMVEAEAALEQALARTETTT